YLPTYGKLQPIASAVTPAPGTYSVVFDTVTKPLAGPFTFRYWINDRSPPVARLLTPSVSSNGKVAVAVADGGSGVDPGTISATIDGARVSAPFAAGRVSIPLGGLARGPHKLVLQVSDYQEEKNSESVAGVLPNTRVYRASFTVR